MLAQLRQALDMLTSLLLVIEQSKTVNQNKTEARILKGKIETTQRLIHSVLFDLRQQSRDSIDIEATQITETEAEYKAIDLRETIALARMFHRE